MARGRLSFSQSRVLLPPASGRTRRQRGAPKKPKILQRRGGNTTQVTLPLRSRRLISAAGAAALPVAGADAVASAAGGAGRPRPGGVPAPRRARWIRIALLPAVLPAALLIQRHPAAAAAARAADAGAAVQRQHRSGRQHTASPSVPVILHGVDVFLCSLWSFTEHPQTKCFLPVHDMKISKARSPRMPVTCDHQKSVCGAPGYLRIC